jgi:sulfide:quinone oxidoreductase
MPEDGRKRVLIAGGGIAALEAALALREHAADRVRIELLAPDPYFWYQPLSVTEPFGLGEAVRLEIDGLARRLGGTRIPGGLTGIDAWRHVAHTTRNVELEYDVLLVACGALPLPAVPGATTFRGAADAEKMAAVLGELVSGEASSLAFVVPWGATWSLPAYELALLTAAHLGAHGVKAELTLVTPEADPLQLFGAPACESIRELLAEAGVALRCRQYAGSFGDGLLELVPGPALAVDRVVALPRLEGAPLDGLPQTLTGFVPVDDHGRVHGVADVFAAGDVTSFPVKQGGLATQQADVAAEAIAAAVGADVEPQPFRPVLRGLLLTGRAPRYLRRELSGVPEHAPVAASETLWWPPAKVVGRYLAPFLAELAGLESGPVEAISEHPGVPVEVELDSAVLADLATTRIPLDVVPYEGTRVAEVMDAQPVVAAAGQTLDNVAEKLVEHGSTACLVVSSGRLVGIVTATDVVRASAARVQPHELPVRLWMTVEPIAVPPSYPASAAALLMSEYGIHHLPVVENERVLGLVELEDVLATSSTATQATGTATI